MRKARALHPGLCSVVETRNDQKSIPLEPLESLSNLADPRHPTAVPTSWEALGSSLPRFFGLSVPQSPDNPASERADFLGIFGFECDRGILANGAAGLFPSPALGERRHRSLARRLIAVCGTCDFSWISRLAKDQQQQPQALPNIGHAKSALAAEIGGISRGPRSANNRQIRGIAALNSFSPGRLHRR